MIHRYSLKGKNFLLDINSGSVHVLDDVSYALTEILTAENIDNTSVEDFYNKLTDYSNEQIKEAYDELLYLYKNGMLYSKDDYIDISQAIPTSAPVKALCLHVSHDCNLRCGYCFAGTGDFGTGRMTMDIDTAKAAIDFVAKKSEKRRNIEIDFFGGEPLMAFETVKATVDYARSIEEKYNKNFHFTITTNGVLLDDDKINYINENMDNVVLSIDGTPDTNDHMRKTVSGAGSYDVIMPKFKKLVDGRDSNKDYYARGTFTKHNLDFAQDVLHIADCGFKHLSVEPVASREDVPYALTEADLPRIYEEYEKLCDILLEKHNNGTDFNFFHFLIDLDQGPCVIKRLRGCGAGYEYVAVTPEGDIYPCHQFVGKDEYKIGNVFDNSFKKEISDIFSALNIYTKPECTECWAKFYCSGGCAAANNMMNDDLKIPYKLACEMEKKRVECAIYLKACGR